MSDTTSTAPDPVRTRRSVLKGLGGLAAASLAGTSLAAGPATTMSSPAPFTLGLLLPGRTLVPGQAEQFQNGLQLALGQDARAQVRVQTARLGERAAAAPEAAQALIDQGAGAIVTLGDGMADLLAPLAESRRLPVIAAEIGVYMPRGEARQHYLHRISLNHWQAQWAHGAELARTSGHVHLLMSTLEAGYDLPYAFTAGFESAGGRQLSTAFLDSYTGGLELQAALDRIRAERPDAVHLLAQGPGADAFIRAYSGLGLGRPALSSGSLTPLAGTHQASSWHPELTHPASAAFVKAYRAAHHRAPDALAALGHETGRWLLAASSVLPGTASTGHPITTLTAARGPVITDPTTQTTSAGLYLRRTTALGQPTLQALTPPPGRHPALSALQQSPRTGWLTPYLHG